MMEMEKAYNKLMVLFEKSGQMFPKTGANPKLEQYLFVYL